MARNYDECRNGNIGGRLPPACISTENGMHDCVQFNCPDDWNWVGNVTPNPKGRDSRLKAAPVKIWRGVIFRQTKRKTQFRKDIDLNTKFNRPLLVPARHDEDFLYA